MLCSYGLFFNSKLDSLLLIILRNVKFIKSHIEQILFRNLENS